MHLQLPTTMLTDIPWQDLSNLARVAELADAGDIKSLR